MADPEERRLERLAESGDLDAADRLRMMRLRSGQRTRLDIRMSMASYHFDSGELVVSLRIKPEHPHRHDVTGGEQAKGWSRKTTQELARYLAIQGPTVTPELVFEDPDAYVAPLSIPDPTGTLEDINRMYRNLMTALAIPAHLVQEVNEHAQERIANARHALMQQRPPATPLQLSPGSAPPP